MFSLLYELGMWLAFLAFLPKAIYLAVTTGKYRSNWYKRFGYSFPQVQRINNGPIFWVHAPSVGETQAISALVRRIKDEIPDAAVVVSSVTETGHETAKRLIPFADFHVYLPFDFYFVVRHILKRCTPDVVILSETDVWYQFLSQCKKRGAISFVASGKISERSFRTFRRFLFLAKRIFSTIDFFCVQSELYKQRFMNLGIAPSKIAITGNIKSDALQAPLGASALDALRKKLGITKDDIVLVVGSSHDPEEEIVLQACTPLFERYPALKVILVPRHPERFSAVEKIVERYAIPYTSWSKISGPVDTRLIVVDAMGVLAHCYQVADLAIVAGSFTKKVGGHNILEPAAYGVATLCGPHMHSQMQLVEIAQSHHALMQVESEQLRDVLSEFIEQPEKRKALGEKGLNMIAQLRGATQKTFHFLQEILPQRTL